MNIKQAQQFTELKGKAVIQEILNNALQELMKKQN